MTAFDDIAKRFRRLDRRLDRLEKYDKGYFPGTKTFTAATISLDAGTSTDGIADLQVLADSNIYHIDEAAATPGIELDVNFASVNHFKWVMVRALYSGGSTHGVRIQLYDNDLTDYFTISTIENGVGYKQYLILVQDDTNYIDAGAVIVRIYHAEAGNASHDLYIDYVGLYG